MKKTATFLLSMIAGQLAMAQTQLPNTNFEDWAIADNTTDSLVGWSSSSLVVIPPVISLFKESGAFQGAYAAKINTAPFGIVQYTTIGILVNGKAEFTYGGGGGGANVEYASGGGTPISVKPSELRGHYKYETNSAADQGTARILLTRFNTTTNKRDTVSNVTHVFPIQPNYTPFTITLTDLMPGVTPDTITTIFSSSNPATVPNNGIFSALFLDSITLFKTPAPPDANFQANVTTGTTNTTTINFDDLSTNTPTAWTWTFTPNTVAYQSGTTAASENPSVKFTAAGSYTVKMRVSNADGADSVTKTAYIQITNGGTGIGRTELLEGDAIYPNPAMDKLFLNERFVGADLKITDIYGKTLVQLARLKQTTVDLSALADGMYIISLTKGEQTRSGKLIIRK